MPLNLTFAGKHGQDAELLKYAYAFEKHTKRRVEPPVTPGLPSDNFELRTKGEANQKEVDSRLTIGDVSAEKVGDNRIRVKGSVEAASPEDIQIEAFVDGVAVPHTSVTQSEEHWSIDTEYTPFEPPKPLYGGIGQVVGNVNIIVLARFGQQLAGRLVTFPQNKGHSA